MYKKCQDLLHHTKKIKNGFSVSYNIKRYGVKAAVAQPKEHDSPKPNNHQPSHKESTGPQTLLTYQDHPLSYAMFHKKSKRIILMDAIPQRFTIRFGNSNDVLSIDMSEKTYSNLQEMLEKERKETSPALNLETVDEAVWKEMKTDYSKLLQYYLKLSKIRLTGLVVLTSMAGYAMAPAAFDPFGFTCVTIGTGLTSGSANTINQFFEVPFDSQMNRTKNRVLVRGYLSPLHAVTFACVSGSVGLLFLALGANPLTAGLGAFNLALYTLVYTPMKRLSIVNTWVGSIVGAVPPMMGWAACSGALDPGAWLMAAVMFAWQFPHFNALSWNLRQDYSRAGYRMMSVVDPALCKRVALRHTLGLNVLCTLSPVIDMTTWWFALECLPLNLYFSYLAWNFYRQGDSNSSRKLFRFSLIHIPLLIVLMIINKADQKDVKNKGSQVKT